MNRTAALLLCAFIAGSTHGQVGKPSCAVLTFDAGEGITAGEAKFVSDRFAAFFGQANIYELVARSRMQEILKMAEFNRMDHCSATDCAVEAGRLLQVQYMVFGSVGHVGELYSLSTSLVEVESGRIISTGITDHVGQITQFVEAAPAKNVQALLKIKTAFPDRVSLSPWEPAPLELAPDIIYPAEPSYIGPRVGLSMLTGVVGIEAQFRHLAVDLGISMGVGTTFALKYYVSPYASSWFVAAGYYSEEEPSAEVYGAWSYTVLGACGGYRWRWKGAWDLSLGLGLGAAEEVFSTYTSSDTTFYGELAFGYSY